MTSIVSVDYQEGPLYEVQLEDGVGHYYNYFVVAEDQYGNRYTHVRNYTHHEKEARDRMIERIRRAGRINLEHWLVGTVWDSYLVPQTYEEEKADYYASL